jgi:hypothetical protein
VDYAGKCWNLSAINTGSDRAMRYRYGQVAAVLFIVLTACADFPPRPDESARQAITATVIALAHSVPQSNFERFARGKPAGTWNGGKGSAQNGGTLGIAKKDMRAAPNPLTAVIAPYLAVADASTVAREGVAIGHFNAIQAADATTLYELIQQTLPSLYMQRNLALSVAMTVRRDTEHQLSIIDEPPTGKTHVGQTHPGVENVLEAHVSGIGFEGGKLLQFYLTAQLRLLRARDGKQLYAREFAYVSDPYPVRAWRKDDAGLFAAELQRAYASISQSMVEQTFLLTALPLASHYQGQARLSEKVQRIDEACGLAWRTPARDFYPSPDKPLGKNFFIPVASRRPELQWESFPRRADRSEKHAALLQHITDVRYDLRLWRVKPFMPPLLVYQRFGLPRPQHKVEMTLAPEAQYFWSVRARFDVRGETRATRWSAYRIPYYDVHGNKQIKPQATPAIAVGNLRDPCNLDFIPTANYYRFKTP